MADLPIVIHVRDADEIIFFRSSARAAAYLEPIDVDENEYSAAYDIEGRRLRLVTKRVQYPFLFGLFRKETEVVEVQRQDTEPLHTSELEVLLRGFLTRTGRSLAPAASLPELIDSAIATVGYVS